MIIRMTADFKSKLNPSLLSVGLLNRCYLNGIIIEIVNPVNDWHKAALDVCAERTVSWVLRNPYTAKQYQAIDPSTLNSICISNTEETSV